MEPLKLKCPACEGPLRKNDDSYICAGCGKSWPITDGIPSFLERPIYWGELSEEEMNSIIDVASKTHWLEAIEYMREKNPGLHQYIVDESRARWKLVLDIDENTRVLDIGSGYGSLSVPVAKAVGQVVAIDSVPQRAKFLQIRAAQEGLDNVVILNSDFMQIPIAPEQFDVVILNGILEWVAVAEKKGKPQDVQLKFLRNIHSLLKKGGHVYVGIESRFGQWAWQGVPDHSGLAYTSIMPKFMANWYVKLKAKRKSFRTDFSKDSYRTYIYTTYGFRKLLNKAGFGNVEFYMPYPGYNIPQMFVPLDDPIAFNHFLDARFCKPTVKSKLARTLLRMGLSIRLHKLWSSAYGIVGCKD